ncbi:hypothetical protein [Microbulbifer taiwanensis]|uniref:hypothetical protein n=1 Tax=Microbulbifer taiwanensis TaxID=986746 RepID=UPI0036225D0A
MGLAGGFFQALIISLVNLGLAAFAAFALRQVFHISAMRKLLFLGLFALIASLCVFFILGVGHYREALELHPFTASKIAVMNLWGAPLGIHDFNSWIMVIVSGMALILLTAKFFIVDDRYPGYTSAARRAKVRQERWMRGCSAAYEEVSALVEEAQRELAEREKEIRAQHIGFKSSIDRSEDIRREYEEDIHKAQGLLDELVRYYQSYSARMMNRRAAYFGELLRFELDKLPKLNTAGLEQHRQDLAYFDRVIEELDGEFADSMDLISRKCGEYQREISSAIQRIERENGLNGL